MSGTGPSQDSYKMPIVMLTFGGPFDALNRLPGEPFFSNKLTDQIRVPSWQYIKSFTHKMGGKSGFHATFELFDPNFDVLLDRLVLIRQQNQRVFVHFRYGWLVDGQYTHMSPSYRGQVVDLDPHIRPTGVEISMGVMHPATAARTLIKGTTRGWPSDTPAEKIVKEALQLARPEGYPLDEVPIVRTPVPCAPIRNNEQPIVLNDTAPLPFVRKLMADNLIIAADPALRHREMRLIETCDNGRAVFTLAPEGWREDTRKGVKRTYHVSRAGNVLDFSPKDSKAIANILGGAGWTTSVLADGTPNREERSGVQGMTTAKPEPPSDKVDNGAYFTKPSFDTDLETMRRRRDVQWAKAQQVSVLAEAEIIGDANIEVNDYLDFYVYRGPTTANMGEYVDSLGEKAPTTLTKIELLSGTYTVTEIENTLGREGFKTKLELTKGRADPPGKRADHTNDAVSTAGKKTNADTTYQDKPLKRYGRNVFD